MENLIHNTSLKKASDFGIEVLSEEEYRKRLEFYAKEIIILFFRSQTSQIDVPKTSTIDGMILFSSKYLYLLFQVQITSTTIHLRLTLNNLYNPFITGIVILASSFQRLIHKRTGVHFYPFQ